jgi:CAAX protease family protein
MHASSTGSLVILSASHLSPAQETLWYAVYAGALWLAVAIVTGIYGKRLVQQAV